jgi:hypothetical protein
MSSGIILESALLPWRLAFRADPAGRAPR